MLPCFAAHLSQAVICTSDDFPLYPSHLKIDGISLFRNERTCAIHDVWKGIRSLTSPNGHRCISHYFVTADESFVAAGSCKSRFILSLICDILYVQSIIIWGISDMGLSRLSTIRSSRHFFPRSYHQGRYSTRYPGSPYVE